MCWNEPISWTTFALGCVFNIYFAMIAPPQYRLWFVFFQLIITVQLGEALIWGEKYSLLGTYISFFSVWLQPIMLSILLYYYNVHPALQYTMTGIIAIYILSSISNIKQINDNVYHPVLCGDNRTHIEYTAWGGDRKMGILYMISSLFAVICLFPEFYVIVGYLIFTLALSLSFYNRIFGSLWCWFGVFSPFVFYIGLRFTKKI